MSKEKKPFTEPKLSVEDLSRALFEANRDLAKVNRELKESEQKRHELVSGLAHDLRQPLAAVSAYAEYLQELPDLDREERDKGLSGILAKVGQMQNYIGELLVLSRLDAKTERPLETQRLPLAPFLEEFFYSCVENPRYAEGDLQLDLVEDFSAEVMVEPGLMVRVLENLFSNALKYSEGPPSITLGAGLQEGEVRVFVADKGIGISPENLEAVFERSVTLGGRREESHGLGLSIARAIVEKHGGRIWCESAGSNGSTFVFTLPALPGQ